MTRFDRVLVLAANYQHFMVVMRSLKISPKSVKYLNGSYDEVTGRHWDNPIIILEGYERNPNYQVHFMNYIGRRFNDITIMTEEEIWNEAT